MRSCVYIVAKHVTSVLFLVQLCALGQHYITHGFVMQIQIINTV